MSTSFKLIFLIIGLSLSQQIFGQSRYFTWVDPQTKLRARINTDTYEILKEKTIGVWQNEGKVKLDPKIFNHVPMDFNNHSFTIENGKKILFQIIGTGQVYEYYPLEKELNRLDNTFHSGFNFTSNQFIRNGTLYSIGGEGFWSYNSTITYFSDKMKEWEILRPKNKGPLAITNAYQGYNSKEDVYYSGGSKYADFLEKEDINYQTDLYLFDFKKNEWQLLGKLNNDLMDEKSFNIIWTGELFFHFIKKSVYIINPSKNKVYQYQDNNIDLDSGKGHYVDQDTLIVFKGQNEGPIQKLSISEIQKKSTYIGKFYTIGIQWYWYYIGLFMIIIIMTILKWKRKGEAMEVDVLLFTGLERKLLSRLLELEPNEYLNTHEINDILESTDKTQENQRKIRFNVIGQINKKLKSKYNWENAIERKALPEDKRLTIYKLDPVVLVELKRILPKPLEEKL
jgi:hypothetical protein